MWIWGWTLPPIVPSTPASVPSRSTRTGISVCAGRLPGAITLGWSGSSENEVPRFCRMIPVDGSISWAPKDQYNDWISETARPSASRVTKAMVSPVGRASSDAMPTSCSAAMRAMVSAPSQASGSWAAKRGSANDASRCRQPAAKIAASAPAPAPSGSCSSAASSAARACRSSTPEQLGPAVRTSTPPKRTPSGSSTEGRNDARSSTRKALPSASSPAAKRPASGPS